MYKHTTDLSTVQSLEGDRQVHDPHILQERGIIDPINTHRKLEVWQLLEERRYRESIQSATWQP